MKKIVNFISILALTLAVSGICPVYAEEQMYDSTDINQNSISYKEYVNNPKGNLDGDEFFTENDVKKMSGYMMGNDEINVTDGDMNEDGNTNILDYILIKNDIVKINKSQEVTYIDMKQSVGESESDYYKYMYDGKSFEVQIDPEEKILINKIKDFRSRYGKEYMNFNLTSYRYADEAIRLVCEDNVDSKKILNNAHDYGAFFFSTTFCFWQNCTGAGAWNYLINSSDNSKGDLLKPNYHDISVGHYKNGTKEAWIVIINLSNINAKCNYIVI